MERSGFFRAMIDNLHDGAYFVGRDRRIVYWNKSAEELTGYASEEVVGRTCDDEILMHVDEEGKDLCRDMCPITETLENGELREAELFLHHKSGQRVAVAIRVAPVRDRKGEITGAVEVFSENSALVTARARIDELERIGTLDPLTRLPSRRCLEQERTSRVDELARFGRTFGVVSIRVDRMEQLNGAFGRGVGNDVLRMVGKSMLPLEDRTVSVTVSVGAVMAEWGDTVDVLVERAEKMMHRGRGRGRDRVTIWK